MKKITLKFLQAKGAVPKGYVGQYNEDEANNLIKRGIAEVYSTEVPVSVKTAFKPTKPKEE